jgi:hypothetical protein
LNDLLKEDDDMQSNGHLSSLAAKHAHLETQISLENQRPLPDTATLSQLKKEKLRIKEEMARITH